MKKTIVGSLVFGIIIFFAFIGLLNYYLRPLIFKTTDNIGYAGAYTLQTVPTNIINDVSYGLTRIDTNGQILPGASTGWEISNGKTYTFKLKKGLHFHNGREFDSSTVGYNFEGVSKKIIDKYTIQFTLKSPYSPFLAAVSQPLFDKDFAGLGRYKITNIDLNGGFLRSMTLEDTQHGRGKKIYFYPTQKALKVALLLGEVSKIYGVDTTDLPTSNTDLASWKSLKTESFIDYGSLVTIFYNYNDKTLNNKKLRQALNYALPEKVAYGKRAYGPIPPTSIYFLQSPNYKISDVELSKTLLSTISDPITQPLEISTTEEYEPVAFDIQKAWDKIGIKTKIKIVNQIPTDFQIFLYSIKLPQDPDQYVLWHSDQANNIMHYKNLRIDKLLEDGRSINNVEERKKIYADFQKYLTDDVPASFFYFPKEYNISKN